MPGRRKKPFIDKKNATTYRIVPKDNAPLDREARLQEQQRSGVYFDDDYDYLQHLRVRGEFSEDVDMFYVGPSKSEPEKFESGESLHPPQTSKPSIRGPSIRAAEFAEDLADLDPEFAAEIEELEQGASCDEEMDDDFVMRLNASAGSDDDDGDDDLEFRTIFGNSAKKLNEEVFVKKDSLKKSDDGEEEDDEDDEEDGSDESDCAEFNDSEEDSDDMEENELGETGATSTLTDKCAKLRIEDELFERYLRKKQAQRNREDDDDDDDVGMDENSEAFKKMKKKFERDHRVIPLDEVIQKLDPEEKEKVLQKYKYVSNKEVEEMVEVVKEVPNDGWDCQSIISCRQSTATQFCRVFELPPKQSKKKKSEDTESGSTSIAPSISSRHDKHPRKKTRLYPESDESDSDDDDLNSKPAVILRNKEENAEEKKARKQAVKEQQRQRREEKSAKKRNFKEEIGKQKHENQNTIQVV